MTSGRHARVVLRQVLASRRVLLIASLILAVVLAVACFELARHGWGFFVDRPAGVGNTPDDPG